MYWGCIWLARTPLPTSILRQLRQPHPTNTPSHSSPACSPPPCGCVVLSWRGYTSIDRLSHPTNAFRVPTSPTYPPTLERGGGKHDPDAPMVLCAKGPRWANVAADGVKSPGGSSSSRRAGSPRQNAAAAAKARGDDALPWTGAAEDGSVVSDLRSPSLMRQQADYKLAQQRVPVAHTRTGHRAQLPHGSYGNPAHLLSPGPEPGSAGGGYSSSSAALLSSMVDPQLLHLGILTVF